MSILHPLRPVIPRGRARWVILGIWILSSAASIPNPVLTQYMQDAGQWVCTNGESIRRQTDQLERLSELFLEISGAQPNSLGCHICSDIGFVVATLVKNCKNSAYLNNVVRCKLLFHSLLGYFLVSPCPYQLPSDVSIIPSSFLVVPDFQPMDRLDMPSPLN